MKRIISVLFLAVGIFFWVTHPLIAETASPGQLVKVFQKAKGEDEKVKALGQLLQLKTAPADLAFYELVAKAKKSEMNVFREAIKLHGTCELQVHSFDLLFNKIKAKGEKYQKRLAKHPEAEAELNEEVVNLTLEFQSSILDPLEEALITNAAKYNDCLIENFKKLCTADDPTLGQGAMMSLIMQEEPGFSALLKSCPLGPERFLLSLAMIPFDGFAVRPLVEAYRNAPNDAEKKSLAVLIKSLPTTPGVAMKATETYIWLSPLESEPTLKAWREMLFQRFRGDMEAMQAVAAQRRGDDDLVVGSILEYLYVTPAKR